MKIGTTACLISESMRLNHDALRGYLHLSPQGRGRREAAGEGVPGQDVRFPAPMQGDTLELCCCTAFSRITTFILEAVEYSG
jgi:hypothetical protein